MFRYFKKQYFEILIVVFFIFNSVYFLYSYFYPSHIPNYRNFVGKKQINNFDLMTKSLLEDPDFDLFIKSFQSSNLQQKKEKIYDLVKKRNSNIDEKYVLEKIYFALLPPEKMDMKFDFLIPITIDTRYTSQTRADALSGILSQIIYWPEKTDLLFRKLENIPPYPSVLIQGKTENDKLYNLSQLAYSTFSTLHNSNIYIFFLLIKYENTPNPEEKSYLKNILKGVEEFQNSDYNDYLQGKQDIRLEGISTLEQYIYTLSKKMSLNELVTEKDFQKIQKAEKNIDILLLLDNLSDTARKRLYFMKFLLVVREKTLNQDKISEIILKLDSLAFKQSFQFKMIQKSKYLKDIVGSQETPLTKYLST
jgi:hypothetical protein